MMRMLNEWKCTALWLACIGERVCHSLWIRSMPRRGIIIRESFCLIVGLVAFVSFRHSSSSLLLAQTCFTYLFHQPCHNDSCKQAYIYIYINIVIKCIDTFRSNALQNAHWGKGQFSWSLMRLMYGCER